MFKTTVLNDYSDCGAGMPSTIKAFARFAQRLLTVFEGLNDKIEDIQRLLLLCRV